jgi:hypothetical protein
MKTSSETKELTDPWFHESLRKILNLSTAFTAGCKSNFTTKMKG